MTRAWSRPGSTRRTADNEDAHRLDADHGLRDGRSAHPRDALGADAPACLRRRLQGAARGAMAKDGQLSERIAALYVDRHGPYFGRADVDAWDTERDARQYAGPDPIVAHPPCGPWGRLQHLYKGDEHDCGPRAVDQVRAYGGVLEHPAGSRLWRACGLPRPGELPDAWGGVSV